jgi:hypothetical protein
LHGYHLEVTRRAIAAELTRCEWRSWRLHRQLATHLTRTTLVDWRPAILANIERLRKAVRGQPHTRNLSRWEQLVRGGDLVALRRALTGLDRDSVEMREVTPMGGLLSEAERTEALRSGV